MVRRRERGAWLVELSISVTIVLMVAASSVAALRAQSREVRTLYEERVAWEAAAGQMARLEAAGWKGLREGDHALRVTAAGYENLRDARCTLRVRPASGGVHRVVVEVAWTDAEGAARTVRVRTLAGRTP